MNLNNLFPWSSTLASRAAEGAALKLASGATKGPLMDVHLPAGDHGSINLGWQPNGAAMAFSMSQIVAQGYSGIRLIGDGPDRTVIRCTSHDGITIAGARGPWTIRLENMRVEAGFRCAGQFGTDDRALHPDFQVHLVNVDGFVPTRESGRTKWCWFLYNADLYMHGCRVDATNASEHGVYKHGSARLGSLVVGCQFVGSGADPFKDRPDRSETSWWGPNAVTAIRDTSFVGWHLPHTDRGGAAIVLQNCATHVEVSRCTFIGGYDLDGPPPIPANARAFAIAISSEGNGWDMGGGFGTGHVFIRDCIAVGHSDVPWNNNVIRAGRNGGATMSPARSVSIQRCGVYGSNLVVSVSGVPRGKFKVDGCNTQALFERAHRLRPTFNQVEANIPTSSRLVPLSEGYRA